MDEEDVHRLIAGEIITGECGVHTRRAASNGIINRWGLRCAGVGVKDLTPSPAALSLGDWSIIMRVCGRVGVKDLTPSP